MTPILRLLPRVLLLVGAALLPSSSLPAQPQEPAVNWRAQWIWLPEGEGADVLLARRVFTLDDRPARAILAITAGARYELYVNGTYMGRGPARSAPHHQSFDAVEVTAALRPGRNALAIRVHHQREGVSFYEAARGGLLAQLDGVPEQVQTDATWRVSPDPSWRNESPRMARFHLEVCDRVDLRRQIAGWRETDFDDSAWPAARVLRRDGGWPLPQKDDRPTHLTPPWTSLVPRDLPFLRESVTRTEAPVEVEGLAGPAVDAGEWVEAAAIPRIPVAGTRIQTGRVAATLPGQGRAWVYDLGEVQNGRPFLEIEGPAGAVVDIMAAPYLVAGSLPSPIVASTYVDRIVLSGGRDRWEAFYLKPTRWLALVFRELSGEATVFGAGVIRSEYPFQPQGYFRVPDAPGLQALWDAAARTVQVCTTDAYTDNYRERRQYAQTSYYAALGNYPIFGDTALQRRYLVQIAQEQQANGVMPAYAPRHGDDFMVILDSNCLWLRGLRQYLLQSGDSGTVRELLPAARRLLGLLETFTNSAGLIENPPYPYWLDHARLDRRGANFCLNAHFLAAEEDFARVLEWLGEPGAGPHRARAEQVRQALRTQFWNPARRLFTDAVIDGRQSDQFSEHANAMALALRIAEASQRDAVAGQLAAGDRHDFVRRAGGLIMVTPAMAYYLHAGLCEAGRADASWSLLEARFGRMLGPGTNGTLWEEWWLDGTGRTGEYRKFPSGRSDAQTESAFPPALFARYILGLEPVTPGLRDVVLRHHPAERLPRRQGAIPTPSGPLEVEWEISPAEFRITVVTPPGTTVRLDLASVGPPRSAGISINGRPVSRDHVAQELLVLPSGRSLVRVAR